MKIPARIRRPIQMIARRRLNGLDCIIFVVYLVCKPKLLLTERLIEELLENIVAHDTGNRIGLAFAMENGRGRLIDAIRLTEGVILVDQGIERATLHESADLGRFRRGENRRDGAVNVARLLPLLLILEKSLFDGLNLAEMCRSARIARGDARICMTGERKIAVNQENPASADVIVHELTVGREVQLFARRALIVAKDFHRYRSALRTKSLVRINVGDGRRIGL